MKEVKEARKQQEKLLERIEAQIAYYDDILRFETGDDTTEKKTMTFQRDTLYQEVWEISLLGDLSFKSGKEIRRPIRQIESCLC